MYIYSYIYIYFYMHTHTYIVAVVAADLITHSPRINTVNLLGKVAGGAFYQTTASPLTPTAASNLGVYTVSVSAWLRPGTPTGSDRIIFAWRSFGDMSIKLGFRLGTDRYNLILFENQNEFDFGATTTLFTVHTWAHINLQIRLDG